MTTFLDDSKILLILQERFLLFNSDGNFICQVDFEGTSQEFTSNSMIENT